MKQFIAGNIIDNFFDVFENGSSKKNSAKNLAKWLSYFQLKSKSGFEENKVEHSSTIAVILNILQKGLPTKLNKYALDKIIENSTLFNFNNENESSIAIEVNDAENNLEDLFFKSLHIIDPRINRDNLKEDYLNSYEDLGSEFEERFLFSDLPSAFGQNNDFLLQLIATQRTISNIVKGKIDTSNILERVRDNFEEQRTDFSIEFPYDTETKPKGIVIEIDGSQHQTPQQTYLDTERDKAIAFCNWNNTLRIKTSDFGTNQFNSKIENILKPAINNEYINTCSENYLNPIWNTDIGKEVMQVSLIPFGIARIQRALLEAISQGILSQQNQNWKIAIIERDLPCASLAIQDLQKLIDTINVITAEPLILPEIELVIFSTKEFLDSNFQNSKAKSLESFNENEFYDLVIDVAILDRNINASFIAANTPEVINIRSINYIDTKRVIATTDIIEYNPICVNANENGLWSIINEDIRSSLEYILQSIFRKKEFRQGQLPIIHNALQCKSVIGLLPTGGGKSLTYQLSAFLQPGICLVIDPIRSLMKDQVDGLLRNNIDSCVYINSTLQGEEKKKAMKKLEDGEVQFVFVSPERLQMEEFRILLEDMQANNIYFSYCVIDEAHCVSEWGHDFRTAYLKLGENALKYCKTKNLQYLPLFGLTATASYDVLADVQRELSGNDEARRITEEAIIRSEYTKRNELQYIVEEVSFPVVGLNTIWDLKNELSTKKQERVEQLLGSIPYKINEFLSNPIMVFSEDDLKLNKNEEINTFEKMGIENYSPVNFYESNKNAGLIFCPHTKGSFGVTDKFKTNNAGLPAPRKGYYDILSTYDNIRAGYFMGSGNDNDDTVKVIQEESFENQDKFINNELNLMVATKAFGMGIDKESIRYTIHVNYPSSIESYVQEAGRAGRDRKMALSYILFNEQQVTLPNEDEPIDHDLDINMYFHKNSFKGVEKELAVLDELLTEIYFPDRTFELENLINNEFNLDIKCNYWEGGNTRNLYISRSFNEPLGYFNLNNLVGYTQFNRRGQIVRSILPEISDKIWVLLKKYIENLNLNEPVYVWIQRSDKQIGIERLLYGLNNKDSFSLTVGFYNDTANRVKTITKWLQVVVHQSFTEQIVKRMRANCTESEAFIEEVCDKYQNFTGGQELNFEALCNSRDTNKNNPVGFAYKMFMSLYNGYRDKMDTEKAIYRLSTLGIIDDYTVNFSSNTFTLFGTKKMDNNYRNNLKGFLLKYYSNKTTTARLRTLNKINEPTLIRKSLFFLVNFVYKEIQKKRQLAMHDMKNACRLGIEKGSVELKDYIDLYFNSKYARTGYSYINEKNIEVNASIPDLTDNAKDEDIELVWLFMEIVEEDPKAGQIDNIKHLRGACTRMLNNQPDSYTLLLLNAFALYMLEYKNPRYLKEAEGLILNAFSNIQEKEPNWSDKKLEVIFNKFTSIILDKNTELKRYMVQNNLSFNFNSIMIKRLLKPLQKANSTLHSLNKILN
ncbi:DEAD/DEAH box helicase [Polaribacter sp. HaHaR_3_91]|uniref:DEAD/DEAH box helicase n=1 Tax=Polaribacter sp. HaHaR_3_91 TaxID=2745561 RepID=UPI001C4E710C|nr:DEAD/DEAH box helicase [Polaribacter sp. HaHaR_3_91]QXP63244.1 ATP-dependent DNA helicase RecQ [Polaribacter sp. HaHaR_3_91]